MLDLRPGDHVECIDNRPQFPISAIMPDTDRPYTVEDVRLNELAPSCRLGGSCTCGNCGWDARRFRRVYRPDPRNLELFKEMLGTPKPAIADPVPVSS